MTYGHATAALALVGFIASSAPSVAMTGIGCPDLPAYARAVGTIEMGEGACNMTTAEARRILAQERPDLYGSVAPTPASSKHRRRRTVD